MPNVTSIEVFLSVLQVMKYFRFNLRNLVFATLAVAVCCAVFLANQPPNLLKVAERISDHSMEIPIERVAGLFKGGAVGSIYCMTVNLDGTYALQESDCFGLIGSAGGTWWKNRNILELTSKTGTGDVVFKIKALLATEENGFVVLTPINRIELYRERGYSPFWSLTKVGDAEKILSCN